MKKKTVLRLLAVVLAVSLAATSGVPGTALTGVETVYAADTDISETNIGTSIVQDVTSISFTAPAKTETNTYAVSATATTVGAITSDNIVNGKVEADNAGKITVTFSGLETNKKYYMYYKVNGTGDWQAYTDSSSYIYTTKKSLKDETITVDTTSYTYDGTAKEPKVLLNGTEIKAADGYTITYSTDHTSASSDTHKVWVSVTATDANETYRKQYKGADDTVTINYTINPAAIGNVTFQSTQSTTYSAAYDGTEQKPNITVYSSGATALTPTTDYTVAYKNNKNVGTATATITGVGNYTGTKELTFTITKSGFTAGSFAISAQTTKDKDTADTLVVETANDPDPALYTVQYALSTSSDPSTFANWQTSKTFTGLTAGTKYYVAYRVLESSNTAATGVTVSSNAYVTKATDISAATVTLVSENDTTFTGGTYNGSAVTPARIDVKIGDTLLVAGTDYETISYKNLTTNKDGDNVNAGTIQVIITGKGKYSGTNKTATYTIDKKKVTVSVVAADNASLEKAYDGTAAYSEANATVKLVGKFKSPYTYAAGDSTISYFSFSGTLASKELGSKIAVTSVDASSAKAYTSANGAIVRDTDINVAQNYDITVDLASDVKANIVKATTLTIGSSQDSSLVSIVSKAASVSVQYGRTIDLKMTNPLGLDLEYTFEKPEIAKQYLTLVDGKLTCTKYTDLSIVLYVSYPASAASEKTNYDGTALADEKVTITITTTKATLNVALNGENVQNAATSPTLTAALTDGEAKIKAAMGVTARYVINGKNDGDWDAEYVYVPYSKLKFEYRSAAVGKTDSDYATTFPTEEGEYKVRISNTDSNITLASPVVLTLTLDNSAKAIDDSILAAATDKNQIVNENGTDMLYKADGTLASNELVDVDGDTYYANKDGEVVKDAKVTVGGKDYILDEDGKVVKGQVTTTPSGNKVYVDATGAIVKNKVVTYKGKKYYATATGRIATNTFVTTKLGNKVYATKDGSLKVNAVFTVGKYKYYAGANGAIAKSGLTKTKAGNTVFATASGKLKVNTTFKYKGHTYKANKKGVVKKVK